MITTYTRIEGKIAKFDVDTEDINLAIHSTKTQPEVKHTVFAVIPKII